MSRFRAATRALQDAAAQGDIAGVRAALAAGAEIDGISDTNESTPLQEAIRRNHILAVEYLISCSANVNLPCYAGKSLATPLDIALYLDGNEILELLLASGADPNWGGPRPCMPLYAAVVQGRRDRVELLLQHGANPELAVAMEAVRAWNRKEFVELVAKPEALPKDDPLYKLQQKVFRWMK